MKWGDPFFLGLAPAVLLVAVFLVWAARYRAGRARRLVDPALWPKVTHDLTRGRRLLVQTLLLLALAFSLLAAARPRLGTRTMQVKRSGIDIILVLDTSASMDAADVVPNRLDRARREMADLIDKSHGDRVGIVIFEGTAFLLCPLTLDYGAARLFLDSVETAMLPVPGTNLSRAIEAGLGAFGKEGNRSRAMVVFSDGESFEGDLDEAIKAARGAGIKIYTVGVGTRAGEPIPIRDDSGHVAGYKKDRSGQVVLSRLDEGTLRRVSDETGGGYYSSTLAGNEVDQLFGALSGLTEKEISAGVRTQYEERFQFFAGLAILALFGLFILPEGARKEEWRGRF